MGFVRLVIVTCSLWLSTTPFIVIANEDFPFRNVSLSFEERVDDLVSRLSLEEMMQQMSHELPKLGQGVPAIPRLGIKNYTWITECLRGDVQAGNATSFPQALGLAASFDSDILFRVARATGIEVRAKNNDYVKRGMYGIHQGLSCFSPVINIMRDPRWGRNQETYGEDPHLTGTLAQSFVRGLQGDDSRFLLVNSGCKHADVYAGPENIPVSRFGFDAIVSTRDWRMTFLPAFKKCVESGTYNIMCSYYSINGRPSCINEKLLTDILRDEWKFKGYVVSDAGAVEHVIYHHHYFNNSLDAVVAAVNAGVNLAVASFKYDYTPVYYSIVDAVNKGRLSIDRIRELMKPMWYTRMKLGEFDPPDSNPYKQLNLSVIESDEHRELALEAAVKSFVLLKNKNNFLPFLSYNNVSIIGPFMDNKADLFGDYPPNTDPKFVTTPFDRLSRLAGNLTFTPGCVDGAPCLKYDKAAVTKAVKYANLVFVCLGLGSQLEGELKDRSTIILPGYQLQLLQDAVSRSPPGTPVMLILFNAGPVDISWAENSDRVVAILAAFYPAQATGEALFQAVTLEDPKNNPAGRLPFTWPVSESQIPPITNYSMVGRTYRYATEQPLYPFGYGLSYTTFNYSNFNINTKIQIGGNFSGSVNIQNTGKYSGDEVVQVYISWPKLPFPAPKLQLVWFDRIYINKNEIKTVKFDISGENLAVWFDDGWKIPTGKYLIYVGGQQPNTTKTVPSNVLQSYFLLV
ncbi:hypothetical protein LOTGIDRAFT_162552 [Lottia gigantea]|uniref:Fibronectin type III-like domain-containing protein n=1 Tax=Lottia gigantea TaxID=225164 RepID=V4A7B2_LOTGI|nr:hypothetical protein LOTGIDRAFT_162552 [Lottia gigantea]ESO92632.1 hypothetical protein LOTGIDRAFT_162552 [Lottia gigantea]